MYAKNVIATTLFMILFIKFGQGLQCYEHGLCGIGNTCKNLTESIVTCKSNETRCWKLAIATGTARGCGDGECKAQVDASFIGVANVCCAENLCNSSIKVKTTAIAIVLMSLIAFVHQW